MKRRSVTLAVTLALLDTVAAVSAAVWIYVAAVAIFTPHRLDVPFVELPWLRRDSVGVAGFVVSAAWFFMLSWRRVRHQQGR